MKKIGLFLILLFCSINLSSCGVNKTIDENINENSAYSKEENGIYEYVILTIEGIKEIDSKKLSFIDETHISYNERVYVQDKQDKDLFVFAIEDNNGYRDIYYVKILARIYSKSNYIKG